MSPEPLRQRSWLSNGLSRSISIILRAFGRFAVVNISPGSGFELAEDAPIND
jgi:hypothetical protein